MLFTVLIPVLIPLLFLSKASAQKQTPTLPPLLTISLPPTQALPNPQTLPPRTFATLTTANTTLTAPFRRDSTFEFRDPPLGSYLCEVWTNSWAFVPMRVDVVALPAVEGKVNAEQGSERKRVDVWQTFRGNEWNNKGEWLGGGTLEQGGITINVGVLAERAFYEARPGCEFSFLAIDR